jgi:hypothetical protein
MAVEEAARRSFDVGKMIRLHTVSPLQWGGVIMFEEAAGSTYANHSWEMDRSGAVEFTDAKDGMDLESAEADYQLRVGRTVKLKYDRSPAEPAT